MANPDRVYVIDTNIIIDYPDIIPNGKEVELESPTVDTSNAHIILPTAVIRELSNFKKESNERGAAARRALKRLRQLTEQVLLPANITASYEVRNPIILANGKARLSIVPIDKRQKHLFQPDDMDMDGQIILTAIVAKRNLPNQEVILLTNDNGLAIRAFPRGIKTSSYGYRHPEAYTGRRDIIVSFDLYHYWAKDQQLSFDLWRKFMPDTKPFIANEFIVMQPQNWEESITNFSNIGRYDAESRNIVPLEYFRKFPESLYNAGQAIYAEALQHPDIDAVIATGPAGTGKTYMATISALDACRKGAFLGVAVVPCHVEETQIGFLPGDINEKLDPNVRPIKNAIYNHLLKHKISSKDENREAKERSIVKQIDHEVEQAWSKWFNVTPVAFARGRDFSHQFVIYDEFQDQTVRQADTLIKRQGENAKVIITGDIEQIHAAYLDQHNNGLVYTSQQYMDHPRVAQVALYADEVVRSTIVRDIARRQQHNKISNHHNLKAK